MKSKIIILIQLFFMVTGGVIYAQNSNTITKTDYILNSGETDTLTAGQTIRILPNSLIASGSTFFATIGNAGPAYNPAVFSNENYVFSRVYHTAVSNASEITNAADVIEEIVYFDGLGRPAQQIGIRQNPNLNDLVTHTSYDPYGRQVKEYLPYVNTGTVGTYKTGDQALATQQFHKLHYPDDFTGVTAANSNAYSESLIEASPLNRPLKQAAPGEAWKMGSGHEIVFDYQTNASSEVVYFEVVFSGGDTEAPQLTQNGYYTPGELAKNITYDENHNHNSTEKDHSVEEFTDKSGRVVLKRTYENEVAHDTYYVYDDFGNLSYVLPPKVDPSNGVSATELSELCYQYKYDYRNRLIEKKIPGKGWEYIVYNKLDQPVMTQDPNLRAQNKWLFTKYDAFGRVTYTGFTNISGSTTRASVQSQADAVSEQFVAKSGSNTYGGTTVYYTNVAYPTSIAEVLSVNYYDDYAFDDDPSFGLTAPTGSIYGQAITADLESLATGSKVKVLGTNNWITSITAYDSKARPIYIASKNSELNTTDIMESKLDFAGKVEETKSTHTKGSNSPIVVTERFSYDHAARLIRQTHQIGSGAEEVIASNTYDELGQLVQKGVGNQINGNRLQTVDYSYNVRGWLKTINDVNNLGNDLFSFKINYDDPTSGDALFNGNISQTQWRTANTDNSLKTYTYGYDALNRIKSATDNTGNYNVSGIDYDKNGNITYLVRMGHLNSAATNLGYMDILDYSYDTGNKLTKVEDYGVPTGFNDGADQTIEYTYDVNGNMITDANKGITGITYNHLNLPTEVVFDNNQNKKITYIYDASGIKQKKIVTDGSSLTTTEYAGNYIYENSTLQFFNTSEGYVEPNGSTYDYIFQCKDHLGNIRLSYSDANSDGVASPSEIREENNYYPFGLKHRGYNSGIVGRNHKYGFTDKEEQDELGLNWVDITARNYDAALGRWMNIDPLAEKMYEYSPYNYAFNNPTFFIDSDGRAPGIFEINQNNGKITKVSDEGDDVGFHTIRVINNQGETTGEFINLTSKPGESSVNDLLRSDTVFSALINGFNGNLPAQQGINEQARKARAQEFFEDLDDFSIHLIRALGDGFEDAGITVTVFGIITGQPEVIGLGEGISNVGTLTNAGVDFIEGKFKKGAARIIIALSGGRLKKLVKKVTETELANEILKQTINVFELVSQEIFEKVNEERNQTVVN